MLGFTCDKTPDQLLREEVTRQALEKAAKAVETRSGNAVYKRAWVIAAAVIRNLKPV